MILNKDDSYTMLTREFHTIQPVVPTITILTREQIESEFAKVVRPIGTKKICPFSLKLSQEECYNIINKCLED